MKINNKKFKLKKGDSVKLISGKDKAKIGKIIKIITKTDRVLVEGCNMVKKHIKPNKETEGKIAFVESSMHISNVMYYDGKNISKIGYKFNQDKKCRYLKKTSSII